MKTVNSLKTVTKNVKSLIEGALADSGGLLRLAPNWVPRSFLQPGKRLKLHPDDLYAYGLNRGGGNGFCAAAGRLCFIPWPDFSSCRR